MSFWKKGAFLGTTALLLAACGNTAEGQSTEENDSTENNTDFKISMVTDMGGVDDRSFNQSAWEGM